MIDNRYSFRPSDKALDACHCVTVADPETSMREMKKWCWASGLGLVWAEPVDLPTQELASQYPVVILFLDKMNSAAPSVQSAAYQLILNRRSGKYILQASA
jgi:hypothetical protein